MSSNKDLALKALSSIYGYSDFRPGQGDIVSSIMKGKDIMALLPTGGGKSICYQIPAIVMSGCSIVISPLISLMKDQVDTLQQLGVEASFINSSLKSDEVNEIMRDALRGRYKLLYVAPERLETQSFIEFLTKLSIGFVAVDEAHCVSQWGHDFRPSYVRIADVLDEVELRTGKRVQRAALTATATPEVKIDVMDILKLKDPDDFSGGFDRPNLRFIVRHSRAKLDDINHEIGLRRGESVVVYCTSRKNVESVARSLGAAGHNVSAYHAGMSPDSRSIIQDDFLFDRIDVIVATNAFGMGIDKSDVRLVVHYDMPGSLEAYYQEAGRAGRDGDSADCVLFYNSADRRLQEFLIDANYPSEEAILSVRGLFVAWSEPVVHLSREEISDFLGPVKPYMVESILALLQDQGIIQHLVLPGDGSEGYIEGWEVLDYKRLPDTDKLSIRRQVSEHNLGVMEVFCRTRCCRRQAILRYFGDKNVSGFCGACDICLEKQSAHGDVAGEDAARTILTAIKQIGRSASLDVLIKVLLGNRDVFIVEQELDKISSFGTFKQWTISQARKAVEYLVVESVLDIDKDAGIIVFLPKSALIMSGDEEIDFDSVIASDSSKFTQLTSSVVSAKRNNNKKISGAYELLEGLRREFSESEHVPPFMIWGQRTMRELALQKPTNKDELSKVFGMGKEKVKRFGDRVIETVSRAA